MEPRYNESIRSRTMSACRSRDTGPERRLRSYLHRKGFRFRLCVKSLPGTPDIVLPRYRTAVFMDGCFWHGHVPCRSYLPPLSKRDYWRRKVAANRARDRRQSAELREAGWTVIRVWECELKVERVLAARLAYLLDPRGSQYPDRRVRDTLVLIKFSLGSLIVQTRKLIRRALRRFWSMRRGSQSRPSWTPIDTGRLSSLQLEELLEGMDDTRFHSSATVEMNNLRTKHSRSPTNRSARRSSRYHRRL